MLCFCRWEDSCRTKEDKQEVESQEVGAWTEGGPGEGYEPWICLPAGPMSCFRDVKAPARLLTGRNMNRRRAGWSRADPQVPRVPRQPQRGHKRGQELQQTVRSLALRKTWTSFPLTSL